METEEPAAKRAKVVENGLPPVPEPSSRSSPSEINESKVNGTGKSAEKPNGEPENGMPSVTDVEADAEDVSCIFNANKVFQL